MLEVDVIRRCPITESRLATTRVSIRIWISAIRHKKVNINLTMGYTPFDVLASIRDAVVLRYVEMRFRSIKGRMVAWCRTM